MMSKETLPCAFNPIEGEPQFIPEITPLRCRNFSRIVELTTDVIGELVKNKKLPEPYPHESDDGQLNQSWGWPGSIMSDVSFSSVAFCIRLDKERDSIFHTQIRSTVTERTTEQPLVWPYNRLICEWDISVINADPELKQVYTQTVQEHLQEAMYDLEDADDIIMQLRKNLPGGK